MLEVMKMFVLMVWNCYCILLLTGVALPRLVITIEDLEALDRNIIEEKATLVDKIVRETDCEGVKVCCCFRIHLIVHIITHHLFFSF